MYPAHLPRKACMHACRLACRQAGRQQMMAATASAMTAVVVVVVVVAAATQCARVANEIKKCKTPEELRKRFDIRSDYSAEEEEEVRRAHPWIGKRQRQ